MGPKRMNRSYVDKAGTCKKIFAMMLERNISVQQASKILGVSCQTVYGWKKGIKFPTLEHLFALKFVLGTTLEDIIVIKETGNQQLSDSEAYAEILNRTME